MITRRIEPGKHYPGLIAYGDANGKEIVVIGYGEEAEQALRAAVVARSAHNPDAGVSAASRSIKRSK